MEAEISGTSFSNLILYSSFIREWSNLWTMEEMSGRARYNVNFARVRGDILILHTINSLELHVSYS